MWVGFLNPASRAMSRGSTIFTDGAGIVTTALVSVSSVRGLSWDTEVSSEVKQLRLLFTRIRCTGS